MSEEPIHWHYTPGVVAAMTGKGIKGILDSRVIRPSTVEIGRKEQPVVWFSSNPVFEATALEIAARTAAGTTFRADNIEDQAIQAAGLYRFGLPESRLRRYLQAAQDMGIAPIRRKRLARTAKRFRSSVEQWWVYFGEISLADRDLSFGYWLEGTWHSAAVSDAAAIVVRCTEVFLPLYEKRLRLLSKL
jgi:hypothetical protein